MTELHGRTIQLFLVDGTPNGLRKATIHGWTGLTFVATESTFEALTARLELSRTGVYILYGPNQERANTTLAYIGSSNNVSERIKQSAAQRTFWQTAIAITTSDDDLSKGHVEYLEARLIQMAWAAERVELDNGNSPDEGRRGLPEADRANMERFLSDLQTILPVVGLDMLKPQPKFDLGVENITQSESSVRFEIFHRLGIKAYAIENEGDFVVLEGSTCLSDMGFAGTSYSILKSELIDNGTLVSTPEGFLRFVRQYAFSSLSAAAAIVLDRNSNGRTEWKVSGTRQSYADWKAVQAKPTGDENCSV